MSANNSVLIILAAVCVLTAIAIILCALGRKKKSAALSIIACIVAVISAVAATTESENFGEPPAAIQMIMVFMIIGNTIPVFIRKKDAGAVISSVGKPVGESVEMAQMRAEMERMKIEMAQMKTASVQPAAAEPVKETSVVAATAKPVKEAASAESVIVDQQPTEMEPQTKQADAEQAQVERSAAQENPKYSPHEMVLVGKKSTCRITEEGVHYQGKDEEFFAPYEAVENFYKFGTLYSFLYKGKEYSMDQTANGEQISINEAFAYCKAQWERACASRPAMRSLSTDGEAVYTAETLSMILRVYNDWCILTAKRNAANLLIMDKFFNGEKKYYYSDLTSVQFREPGKITDGYLEFEYPGSRSGKNTNSYSSENSITFGKQHTPLMKEIYTFIDKRIGECKNGNNRPSATTSAADELIKFKSLLEAGVITQEEFDAKKKQLLGL